MNQPVAFCPNCFGLFQSRYIPPGPVVTMVSEPCMFCGSVADVETNRLLLEQKIRRTIAERTIAKDGYNEILEILTRLQLGQIKLDSAEAEINRVSPGFGSKISEIIRKNGIAVIPTLASVVMVWISYSQLQETREANQIARDALQHAIEQTAVNPTPQVGSSKKVKDKASVTNTRPHRAMGKNRKMRRAEKAKKRRDK